MRRIKCKPWWITRGCMILQLQIKLVLVYYCEVLKETRAQNTVQDIELVVDAKHCAIRQIRCYLLQMLLNDLQYLVERGLIKTCGRKRPAGHGDDPNTLQCFLLAFVSRRWKLVTFNAFKSLLRCRLYGDVAWKLWRNHPCRWKRTNTEFLQYTFFLRKRCELFIPSSVQ